MIRVQLEIPLPEFNAWIIQTRKRVHSLLDRINERTVKKLLAEHTGKPADDLAVEIAELQVDLQITESMLQRMRTNAKPLGDWGEWVEPQEEPPPGTFAAPEKSKEAA
jgi:hypothetical protein